MTIKVAMAVGLIKHYAKSVALNKGFRSKRVEDCVWGIQSKGNHPNQADWKPKKKMHQGQTYVLREEKKRENFVTQFIERKPLELTTSHLHFNFLVPSPVRAVKKRKENIKIKSLSMGAWEYRGNMPP